MSFEGDSVNRIVYIPTIDTTELISLKDTISPILLRVPDSLSSAKIADILSKGYGYPVFKFNESIKNYPLNKDGYLVQKGNLLPKGELWILITIVVLILIFAILKQTFSKQIMAIIYSFFNNKALSNLNKEDNLFNSWPFLLLFVQIGFTLGLFIYLTAIYRDLNQVQQGFKNYISISLFVIGFYALKILILKILGYFFMIQKPINEYIAILYLSYFNAALIFLPLVLAFSLSPINYSEFYIVFAVILLAIIFIFQLIRAGINILNNYRFPKVYLFLYFCTLEICPIIILIKALGF